MALKVELWSDSPTGPKPHPQTCALNGGLTGTSLCGLGKWRLNGKQLPKVKLAFGLEVLWPLLGTTTLLKRRDPQATPRMVEPNGLDLDLDLKGSLDLVEGKWDTTEHPHQFKLLALQASDFWHLEPWRSLFVTAAPSFHKLCGWFSHNLEAVSWPYD